MSTPQFDTLLITGAAGRLGTELRRGLAPLARRLRKHLRQVHNLDLDRFAHETLDPQRGLSARAIDRIRWAGVLEMSQRITHFSAGNRVRAAVRDDLRWFTKHGW